jgi:hypothetical protein
MAEIPTFQEPQEREIDADRGEPRQRRGSVSSMKIRRSRSPGD